VLRFANLRVDLAGEHTMTAPAIPQPLRATAASAEVRVNIRRDGRLAAAELATGQVAVRLGDLAAPILEWAGAGISFSSPDDAAVTSRLIIDAKTIALPATIPPLARTVDRLHLSLDLQGPVGRGPLPLILEAWRSAGGAIEVRDFALEWPPLTMSGNGTAALDDSLQPLAAFTLKIAGFTATVDALEARRYVQAEVAAASRLILGLLAKVPAGGGAPELSLAFTVQDRKLQAGPVTLMDVPEVIWSTGFVIP
jgi:hypothetical protein